jgi:general secretion pathway protein G
MSRAIIGCVVALPLALVGSLFSAPQISDPVVYVATTDVENLRRAVDLFREDNHRLPSSEIGLSELTAGPFPKLERLPKDPWGHEFKYRTLIDHQSYQIYSVGKNGKDEGGEGDDVQGRERKYTCADYGVNCPPTPGELVQSGFLAVLLAAALYLLFCAVRWSWRSARGET